MIKFDFISICLHKRQAHIKSGVNADAQNPTIEKKELQITREKQQTDVRDIVFEQTKKKEENEEFTHVSHELSEYRIKTIYRMKRKTSLCESKTKIFYNVEKGMLSSGHKVIALIYYIVSFR